MISEKLLSKILGYEVSSISEAGNNIEFYMVGPEHWRVINIYELANKCKEWAYSHRFILEASKYNNNWRCDVSDLRDPTQVPDLFKGLTEPETVFKACEWVMERLGEVNQTTVSTVN